MQEYNIVIREILEKTVTVKAESRQEARGIVQEMYEDEEIELDWEDFLSGEVICRG